MKAPIVRAFKAWCRANKRKNPTAQDAVQFFTDRQVADKWPEGVTWPVVYAYLEGHFQK